MDCFGKLSVWKALNPLKFSKGNFHLERSRYGKFKAYCFWINKNLVSGTEERSAKIFGKEIRPKIFKKWTKMPLVISKRLKFP